MVKQRITTHALINRWKKIINTREEKISLQATLTKMDMLRKRPLQDITMCYRAVAECTVLRCFLVQSVKPIDII